MRATIGSPSRNWLESIPKIELHLHLEGAIPIPCMWELIQKYGGDPDISNMRSLEQRFQYTDFSHFIKTWVWKNKFIREYEDFDFIARSVAEDLKAQNIVYAEAFISPPDFVQFGLEIGRIIEAVRLGLQKAPGIKINLIVDLVRDYGPKTANSTFNKIMEVKSPEIIGIGIGGSEKEFPPELFSRVFERARENGFKTSAHAGEAAGPKSVWGAIRHLKVDRIGHGTRAIEDPELVDFLVENKIPIEMCPLSNLRTQVVSTIKDHPIRNFFDRGALVTVNTDDPKMFNNSLVDEFEVLTNEHDFTVTEIKQLIQNAIKASWLSDLEKKQMSIEFEENPIWEP